jgi:predicted transcriptional regulator
MPKKGPDSDKIKKIRKVLSENPRGLWIREIARKSGLDKSTVSIYLSKHMENDVEEIYSIDGGLIKIVRLKK